MLDFDLRANADKCVDKQVGNEEDAATSDLSGFIHANCAVPSPWTPRDAWLQNSPTVPAGQPDAGLLTCGSAGAITKFDCARMGCAAFLERTSSWFKSTSGDDVDEHGRHDANAPLTGGYSQQACIQPQTWSSIAGKFAGCLMEVGCGLACATYWVRCTFQGLPSARVNVYHTVCAAVGICGQVHPRKNIGRRGK